VANPNAGQPAYRHAKVSVIGAGKVGSTLAQRLVEKDLAHVTLLDIVEGRPQGLALDLMQAAGIERHSSVLTGTNSYDDTADSDVVVITAGLPRKPGMSRDDLLQTNAEIVVEAARQVVARSPNAILLVVTNPLDTLTYLVWRVSGLPPERVMGMAGILDSARFQTFIAWELGVSVLDVTTLVLGGHGDLMTPLTRYSTVNGVPLPELLDPAALDRLVERTRHGGAEVVGLMKTGGAYYAPASATCQMVAAILHNQSRLLPVSAYLRGEYGLNDLFLGVPIRLGRQGVEQIVELDLTPAELMSLQTSGRSVQQMIATAIAALGL